MKLSNRIMLVAVSLILAAAMMACGKKEENTNTAPKGPDDSAIKSGVTAKLNTDMPGNTISVDSKDGVVTLTGEVKTPEDKTKAEQSAKSVASVKSVTNNIRIAFNAADAEIKKSVEANLTKNGVTGISVEVKDNEVTLRGDIARAKLPDAMKAANEAQPTPKKVNNQMNIK